MTLQPYSVYGCWDDRERFAEVYRATSPRAAKHLAQLDAAEKGGVLWVCRVVAGEVPAADLYTAFVDPEDDRNLDRDDLEPDVPELGGAPDWTVFGIALPRGTADGEVGWTGERYGDTVAAVSAKAAEDVARSRVADKRGELWVCTVLAGRVTAADTYAPFVDPDVRSAESPH